MTLTITKLCSVKVVNVGAVTAKLDAVYATNSQRVDTRRDKKRNEEEEEATRKIANKAMKFNTAMEEPLAQTVGSLLAHMKAMGNAVEVSKDYLKRRYNGRLLRAEKDEFTYPSNGPKYRSNNKKKKLKMTPGDNQNDLIYW
jgi:hypothetical protein